MVEYCMFCDKIIVPKDVQTTSEIKNFFDENNLPFSLKHVRSRIRVGNKIICFMCEEQLKRFLMSSFFE